MDMVQTSYYAGLMAIGILYFLLFRRHVRTHQRMLRERNEGVTHLSNLTQLLQHLQQHRGMSGALLSGNKGFNTALQEKQYEIDAAIRSLDKTVNRLLGTRSFWNEIPEGWDKIKHQLHSLSAEQSFSLHTHVILRLLDVMEEFGDVANLTTVSDQAQRQLSELIVNKLPGLSERLGQARALGTSAAAAGLVPTVLGMRLTFLSGQIIGSLGHIDTVLAHFKQMNIPQYSRELSRHINGFLDTLQGELIQIKIPTIGAEAYFKLATNTIDEVYAMHGRLCPMLSGLLTAQGNHIRRRLRLGNAVMSLGFAGLIGAYVHSGLV